MLQKLIINIAVEKIGVNCEYKKKNITAIQLICDNNKIPY